MEQPSFQIDKLKALEEGIAQSELARKYPELSSSLEEAVDELGMYDVYSAARLKLIREGRLIEGSSEDQQVLSFLETLS